MHIDGVAPTTAISCDPPSGWSKTAVTATFTPSDATSDVATTEYSTDDGATWTTGLSAVITTQGPTTLRYRSTDNAGNVEAFKTKAIGVDPVKPTPKALTNKTVRKGRTVKLPYRVSDASCPKAKVTIKVYKGSTLRKTLCLGLKATGTNLTCSYKCSLAKGKYTWKVYATDLAGNKQVKPSSKTLIVMQA